MGRSQEEITSLQKPVVMGGAILYLACVAQEPTHTIQKREC